MPSIVLLIFIACISVKALAAAPTYKPSSYSAEPIDISLNAYGASSMAPEALAMGEIAPDFELPVSGGGLYTLSKNTDQGIVAIIFYRGHW